MNRHLTVLARQLARLRPVPPDVLSDLVTRDGLCFWAFTHEDPPDEPSDSALAARLCAGCPVQDECLELELRTAGADTVGVWGAMAEDDRRRLYPLWLREGGRER